MSRPGPWRMQEQSGHTSQTVRGWGGVLPRLVCAVYPKPLNPVTKPCIPGSQTFPIFILQSMLGESTSCLDTRFLLPGSFHSQPLNKVLSSKMACAYGRSCYKPRLSCMSGKCTAEARRLIMTTLSWSFEILSDLMTSLWIRFLLCFHSSPTVPTFLLEL